MTRTHLAIVVTASLAGLLFGFDTAVIAGVTHWIMNAVVSAVFPAVAAYSAAVPFAFFALMMALQFVVVAVAFPETKGVTLERMAERMR